MIIDGNKTVFLSYTASGKPSGITIFKNGEEWIKRAVTEVDKIKFNTVTSGNFEFPKGWAITSIKDTVIKPFEATLPPPERSRVKPFVIKYNKHLEGTPARIFTLHTPAIIEVSKGFRKLRPQIRMFIILHELGHMLYQTEEYADMYALSNFLNMGFSANEAYCALAEVLSNPHHERILFNYLNLKNNGYIN